MQRLRLSNPELLVFGGSFDPPHRGHLECLQFSQASFPQAEFFVVPSFLPPLSRQENKSPSASFEDRLAMCRLAFAACVDAPHVLDIEKNLATPNYTIQTLRYFQQLYPKKNLAWLIGFDQLAQFHRWSEPLAILDLASLIVLSRDNGDFLKLARDLARNLGRKIAFESPSQLVLEGLRPIFFVKDPITTVARSDRIFRIGCPFLLNF